MNRTMILNVIGYILRLEAALMVLPLIVSLIYGDGGTVAFIVTIIIALALGCALSLVFKTENHVIYAREGFVIVALAWIMMSAVGALPFVISGDIPSYIDALFETVSGFTTTGASILNDVESLSHGILFWRSFTHWLGGMGVLVFIMAIVPNISDRSIHIIRAEMPGPVVGKLVPKVKDTAKILYLIYIALTVAETVFLMIGGMPFFDSLLHSFGTAGTGGFGLRNDSIAGYSPYIQWVIAAFMLIFGVNFNLYYLILVKKAKAVLHSTELWFYIALVAVSSGIIMYNVAPIFENVSDSLRASVFQVSSIITTTGYATADFNSWPALSRGFLFILMFVGGCAGSTAGGFKLSRVIMLFRMIRRELKHMLHPRSVEGVRIEGKRVDEAVLNSTGVYFAFYFICIVFVFLIISFEPFGIESNFSTAVSCFNNVGPIFGGMPNLSQYSDFSKIVLSFAMLLGRLEIYPVIIALSPSTWSKK